MKLRKYRLIALLCLLGLAGCSIGVDIPSHMNLAECRSALSDSYTGWSVLAAFVIGFMLG
jgi:hypothetical protein